MPNEFIKHYNHMRCPYCNSEMTEHVDSFDNEEKRICRNCGNDYLIEYTDDTQDVIINVTTRNRMPIVYTWKDIIIYNGKAYFFEFPISGDINTNNIYRIDDFLESARKALNISKEEFETNTIVYTMEKPETIEAATKNITLPVDIAELGAYINGISQWVYQGGHL